MSLKEYLGDLIGGNLLITESRIIAKLLMSQVSKEEWKSLIIGQNVLQKKSVQTAMRYARTIRNRLEGLGVEFMTDLLGACERAYVQMLLIALLIHSPIVVDFMSSCLAEAHRTYKPSLAPNSWSDFYDTRARAYADLGRLSDSTIKKMGNNAIKALIDSGYLSDGRTKTIQPVYLMPENKDWLVRLAKEELIDVMECTT